MNFSIFQTITIFLILISCSGRSTPLTTSQYWQVSKFLNMPITGVTIEGSPELIKTSHGKSVSFDGNNERILVNHNPLADLEEFSIEALIFPRDGYPNNTEPRFFHIESHDSPNRRLTLELRITANKTWYYDAFIKSDIDKFTLVDPKLTHPINRWYHIAVTYKNKVFTSYINGNKELSATVSFQKIPANAKSSIGARMNQIHWFNGMVHSIRISPRALPPEKFDIPNLVRLRHAADTSLLVSMKGQRK